MTHKERRSEAEWWAIRPKLRLILADADWWCQKRNVHINITGLIRSGLEQWALWQKNLSVEHSVHELGRGADASVLHPEELNQQLMDYINHKYPYDTKRIHLKTVIRHVGTADHLHFQTYE